MSNKFGSLIQSLRAAWGRNFWLPFKDWIADPEVHLFFKWCLPALAIGLVLRVWLMISLPYAYFQFDSPDFLETPYEFFANHRFALHGKKAFLVPTLYTIAFFFPGPALCWIAAGQHLLGLLFVVTVGGLIRLWCTFWKVVIVPATILVAIEPDMLWYEHSLMSEIHWIFWIGALMLAATVFYLRRTETTFWLLLLAGFLTAGARPEGRLLFFVPLLTVALVCVLDRKRWLRRISITLGLLIVTFLITRTQEGGKLLYASVIHLTPDKLKSAPGFEPVLIPLRDEFRTAWVTIPLDMKNVAKQLGPLLDDYLKKSGQAGKMDDNELAMKLATEAMLNHPEKLPWIAIAKFLKSFEHRTAGEFDEYWLGEKQETGYGRRLDANAFLSKGMTGRTLTSQQDFDQFLKETSVPARTKWFNVFHDVWSAVMIDLAFPDQRYPDTKLFGLPYFFLIAFLGLLATVLKKSGLWPLQAVFFAMWLGLFAVCFLAAAQKERFRFIFEPFGLVYVFVLVDHLISAVSMLSPRLRSRSC